MGLKINVTYDASVTALQTSNPTLYAQYTAAVQTAVNYFQNTIATPITVNINFGWGEVGGSPVTSLGASSTSQYTTTYAQLLAQAKTSLTTSPVQLAALASLPATDPTNGATFSIATADAAALGFDTTGFTIGGSAGLSSSTTWAWTQNNIPAGSSDAIGTLEHEISEVLGRSDEGGKGGQYSLLDMFRYTAANGQSTNVIGAAAGARDQPFVSGYSASAPSYFSYNGKTVTLLYETPANVVGGADVGDWAPSVPSDSFGDATTSGIPDLVSPTDLGEMNVVGYTLTANALPMNFGGNAISDLVMTNNNNGALFLAEVKSGAETYTQIGGLGPQWQFGGYGNLLGDGNAAVLLWNNSTGALVVGENNNGAAQYKQIGGLGSAWQFEGAGQLLGTSTSDFLLWNNSTGALVTGTASTGTAVYTQIGGVGSAWQFEGVGTYLGDGSTDFLMENSSTGALVAGKVVSGAAQYTQVGGLGSQWKFEGTGNLLGNGQDDFLIWNNTTGALVVGEVHSGAAQYTQVGAVGSEWQFLGVGDYDGANNAEFMMRNSNSGALVIGTVVAGTASYQAVGGLGSEWNLHANNPALLG